MAALIGRIAKRKARWHDFALLAAVSDLAQDSECNTLLMETMTNLMVRHHALR